MRETGTPPPPPPWSGQTIGQRIVTAAWVAVAAHLAAADRDRPDAAATDDDLPPAIADRLR